MVSAEVIHRYYPGRMFDGTYLFYSWVRKEVRPETVLLNLGASGDVGRTLRSFKGEVARVVGADISPEVMKNPSLDEAHVYHEVLPFADETFDVVISDFVLEHVEKSAVFLAEVHRVLKKDCSFFFRTPNVFHYVSLAGCLTPQRLHVALSNRMRGLSGEAHEPWPTYYRLNSCRAIAKCARQIGFKDIDLRLIEAEPSYLLFHPAAFYLGLFYERIVNKFEFLKFARANIFGKLLK